MLRFQRQGYDSLRARLDNKHILDTSRRGYVRIPLPRFKEYVTLWHGDDKEAKKKVVISSPRLNTFVMNDDYHVKKAYVLSNARGITTKVKISYLPIYDLMFFGVEYKGGKCAFF